MSELELIDIFSGNLRSLLEDSRVSPAELSRTTGLSESTISRYLAGKRMPTLKAVINICHVLDCDFEELIPIYDIVE